MTGQRLENAVPILKIMKQIQFFQYNLKGSHTVKIKRVKLLPQAAVEKAFQKAISSLRGVRGFVNLEAKVTIRVHDASDPNKAIVLVSKHAV